MLTKMTRVQAPRAKSEHFMPYYLLPFTANYYVPSDNTKVGLIIQKLAPPWPKSVLSTELLLLLIFGGE